MRNYQVAIRKKETKVLGGRADGCWLQAGSSGPQVASGQSWQEAGALLLSLHYCTCMLLRVSWNFFLSFLWWFPPSLFPPSSFSFLPSSPVLYSTTFLHPSFAQTSWKL